MLRIGSAALLVAVGLNTSPPVSAQTLQLLDARVLSVTMREDAAPIVTEADFIPYVVGTSCYHWVIRFVPVQQEIVLHEALVLPAPAEQWGVEGQNTQVNQQRSASLTEHRIDGRQGIASNGWCVAQGDPVGRYEFTIRKEGVEIARLKFTVGDLH